MIRGSILSTLLLKAIAGPRCSLPITAVDSITPAVEHTRQQLFMPFRIGQWTKLAFVGLLAGELGSNGCNRSNFHLPAPGGSAPHIPEISSGIDPALVAALVSGVIAALAIGIILMYVGSVMRFVLFDSIVAKQCRIRWSWNRRLGAGWRYFVWKLLYGVIALAAIAGLVGIPVAVAFANGWMRNPQEHLPGLILGGIFLAIVMFAIIIASAVILVLTKDFVIPQMALENIDAIEGWRRLWLMMKAEKGSYAGYVAMKIVLGIVVGILIAITAVILGVFFVVPTVGLSLLAIISGKTAGLTWNAYTITLAVVVGCIVLGIFLFLVSLISVPAIVFFPAYSLYFFAGRYPRLDAALRTASAGTEVPTGATALSP